MRVPWRTSKNQVLDFINYNRELKLRRAFANVSISWNFVVLINTNNTFVELVEFHDFGVFQECSWKHKSISAFALRPLCRGMLQFLCQLNTQMDDDDHIGIAFYTSCYYST